MKATCRVVGFGSCSTSGYPFSQGHSYFNQGCERLCKQGIGAVEFVPVSLPGCSANGAVEHLQGKALSLNPHAVVIQFGQTDVARQVTQKLRSLLRLRRKRVPGLPGSPVVDPRQVHLLKRPARTSDHVRWIFRTVLTVLLRVKSVTPLELYLSSIRLMAEQVLAAGAKPIIITPCRLGNRLANRQARLYAQAVVRMFDDQPGVRVINGYEILRHYPLTKTLLRNGMHLSPFGHELVGDHLCDALHACFREEAVSVPQDRLAMVVAEALPRSKPEMRAVLSPAVY